MNRLGKLGTCFTNNFVSTKKDHLYSNIYMSQAKYNAMAKYTLPKYYLTKYTLTWILFKVHFASEAKYTLPSNKMLKHN